MNCRFWEEKIAHRQWINQILNDLSNSVSQNSNHPRLWSLLFKVSSINFAFLQHLRVESFLQQSRAFLLKCRKLREFRWDKICRQKLPANSKAFTKGLNTSAVLCLLPNKQGDPRIERWTWKAVFSPLIKRQMKVADINANLCRNPKTLR